MFPYLPPEVILNILRYITLKDLVMFSAVSQNQQRKFRHFLNLQYFQTAEDDATKHPLVSNPWTNIGYIQKQLISYGFDAVDLDKLLMLMPNIFNFIYQYLVEPVYISLELMAQITYDWNLLKPERIDTFDKKICNLFLFEKANHLSFTDLLNEIKFEFNKFNVDAQFFEKAILKEIHLDELIAAGKKLTPIMRIYTSLLMKQFVAVYKMHYVAEHRKNNTYYFLSTLMFLSAAATRGKDPIALAYAYEELYQVDTMPLAKLNTYTLWLKNHFETWLQLLNLQHFQLNNKKLTSLLFDHLNLNIHKLTEPFIRLYENFPASRCHLLIGYGKLLENCQSFVELEHLLKNNIGDLNRMVCKAYIHKQLPTDYKAESAKDWRRDLIYKGISVKHFTACELKNLNIICKDLPILLVEKNKQLAINVSTKINGMSKKNDFKECFWNKIVDKLKNSRYCLRLLEIVQDHPFILSTLDNISLINGDSFLDCLCKDDTLLMHEVHLIRNVLLMINFCPHRKILLDVYPTLAELIELTERVPNSNQSFLDVLCKSASIMQNLAGKLPYPNVQLFKQHFLREMQLGLLPSMHTHSAKISFFSSLVGRLSFFNKRGRDYQPALPPEPLRKRNRFL